MRDTTSLMAAMVMSYLERRGLWSDLAAAPRMSQRCPSKWGAGDQRGSGNHMKPETVLRATRLIRTGEVFELGRVFSESMPLSGRAVALKLYKAKSPG